MKKDKRDKTATFTLTQKEFLKLKKEAEKRGLPVSSMIRFFILKGLEK